MGILKRQYLVIGAVLLMASQALVAGRPGKPAPSEPKPTSQTAPGTPSRPEAARVRSCAPPGLEQFTISGPQPRLTQHGNAGYVIDQSGYYVLAVDLDARAFDVGILVLAGNVVLDLDSHTLRAQLGTAVRVADHNPRLTVRNGTIDGGSEGIAATGPQWGGSLKIERITFNGAPGVTDHSILVSDVANVAIVANMINGPRIGIALSGWTTSGIQENHIKASEVALASEPLNQQTHTHARQEVRSNHLEAPRALSTGAYSFIEGNRIRGAVELDSAPSRFRDNDISLPVGAYAVTTSGGPHLIEGNRISGGAMAAVRILGEANRFSDNAITADNTGVEVSGKYNLIEHNTIKGNRLSCGIRFSNDGDHVHRGNTTSGSRTPICGEPNIDGGAGDSRPPQFPRSPRGPASRLLPGPSRPELARSAECPSETFIPIDGPSPTNTPVGPAAILIDKPGHYVLTSDLSVSSGTGIVIDADDVTLDLGGHTLSCRRGHTIRVLEGNKIVIRNGFVSDGEGIFAAGTAALRVEDVDAGCSSSSGCLALSAGGIGHIEIVNSQFHGVESGVNVHARTGRITGSQFRAIESAMLAVFSESGLVRDSLFRSDDMTIAGSATIVDNVIRGRLEPQGGTHYIAGNMITGTRDFSLDLFYEPGTTENNIIMARRVRIESPGRQFTSNMIVGYPMDYGVSAWIFGDGHRLDDNFIVRATCGLYFDRAYGNSYRDNVVLGSGEGACGTANTNDGGNVFPAPTCGNGHRGETEICDGYDHGRQGCPDLGYEGGGLNCTDECEFDVRDCLPGACGNGIKEGDEWCDGDELGWRTTCLLFGGFDSGELRCGLSCDYDLSGCTQTCGNGWIVGTEACDGTNLGGQTCVSQGFDGGELACNPMCSEFDYSGCATVCGNGKRSPDEVCDGGDLGGQTCVSRGFTSGSLACTVACDAYVTSGCTTCGNNVREGEEICDGTDLGGNTCGTFGFTKGTLACGSDCRADISNCGV